MRFALFWHSLILRGCHPSPTPAHTHAHAAIMTATTKLPFYLVLAFVVDEDDEGEGGERSSGEAACPYRAPSGNPAAVVLIPRGTPLPLPYASLAAEFAQSETAFVEVGPGGREEGGRGEGAASSRQHGLRWFTPSGVEVGMCGHATLAAAAGLIEAGLAGEEARFATLSGGLSVVRDGGGGRGTFGLTLSLPARPPTDGLPPSTPALLDAVFGGSASPGQRPTVIATAFNAALGYLVVEVGGGAAAVRRLAPDPALLVAATPGPPASAGDGRVAGLIVLALERPNSPAGGISWRFFGPWIGIAEDTATGSAAAVVAPWLLARGLVGVVTKSLVETQPILCVRQLSPRGGAMRVWLAEGGSTVRVGARVSVRVRGEVEI